MSTSECTGKASSRSLVERTVGEEYQGSGSHEKDATGPEIDPAIRARVWRWMVGLSVGFWVAASLLGLRGCAK